MPARIHQFVAAPSARGAQVPPGMGAGTELATAGTVVVAAAAVGAGRASA
ncbi:MAG: hypothetical protein ACRD2W_00235 [Acidimicrobiales bacterium]